MDNLVFRGRYKKEGKIIQFFNTGSGLSLYFKGTQISFDLLSIMDACYVDIIIDFDFNQKRKYLVDQNATVTVTFEDDKAHYIDLVKVNEAKDTTLVIKDINFNGEILKYTRNADKFVKMYGDSSIAGYAILAREGEQTVHNSDGVENFCFRALYELGYDYDIFTGSGWGLTFSAYTNPMETGIEKYRENLCVNSNEKWVSKKADLLLISLGTNDMAYIDANPSKREQLICQFIAAYERFIKKERENNSSLPVLMIYGTLLETSVYEMIERTYNELSKKLENLYIVKLPGDNSAINFHSYIDAHKEMSEVLKQKIVSILR